MVATEFCLNIEGHDGLHSWEDCPRTGIESGICSCSLHATGERS